jgi:hypothetical protein
MSESRILVGIPSGEKTIPTSAFLQFMKLAGRGIDFTGTCEGPVSLVRDSLVREFLKHPEFTHLLMLDSDHIHPLDIIERLARWIGHPNKPRIIGGLNYQRKPPYRPCAFMFKQDEPTVTLLTISGWPDGLVQVDAIGASALLVERSVFEELKAPWFEFAYQPTTGDEPKFVGEDIWFCWKAKLAGIDIYCDTTTTSPHIGERMVGDRDFRDWLATNPDAGERGEVQTRMMFEGTEESSVT